MSDPRAPGDGPSPSASAIGPGSTHWEGEPLSVWETLWEIPRFEAYPRLGSTNDRVRALAREGAPAFTVVTAEEQTEGCGRSGRSWASAPGLGLWISLLLRLPASEARLLAPLLVGLGVCRAVERVAPDLEPGIKWPNDILLGDRKVCGILCEGVASRRDAVVAGVGVNVAHRPSDFPPGLRPVAVSLAMATGREVSRSRLAGHLVRDVRRLLSRPTFRLEGDLARELRGRDVLRGKLVQVAGDGSRGVAAGIDPGGALCLERPSGTVSRVVAGSVHVVAG